MYCSVTNIFSTMNYVKLIAVRRIYIPVYCHLNIRVVVVVVVVVVTDNNSRK